MLNPICHADYSLPSNIKVEFFPDRVKIINPGNVFDSTLDAVLDGVQTFKNPGLVNIFYKLGFIEYYGTGLIRIREAYSKEKLQPEFKVIDSHFFATLPNLNYNVNEARKSDVGENIGEESLEEKLIVLIKNNSHIFQREMAAAIGKTRNTVERIIKSFKRIKRSGPNRGGYWEIVNKKEN